MQCQKFIYSWRGPDRFELSFYKVGDNGANKCSHLMTFVELLKDECNAVQIQSSFNFSIMSSISSMESATRRIIQLSHLQDHPSTWHIITPQNTCDICFFSLIAITHQRTAVSIEKPTVRS